MSEGIKLKRSGSKKRENRAGNIIAYIILIPGGLIMVYPVLFIILASFFTPEEFNSTILNFFPIAENPTAVNWKNLIALGADKAIRNYYFNSIWTTLYATFCSVITSFLGGYIFARLKFRGRNALFTFMLMTNMVPGIIATLPTYLELVRFPFFGGNYVFTGGTGLFDCYGTYILLFGPCLNVMGTFLVKQQIEALPNSYEEAAKVDGAGFFRIVFVIVLPLVKPMLAFIAINTSIGCWNNWATPFYYTESADLQTIASAISRQSIFAGREGTIVDYPAIMSYSLLLTIPSVILFFCFQKYIIQGLVHVGLKG